MAIGLDWRPGGPMVLWLGSIGLYRSSPKRSTLVAEVGAMVSGERREGGRGSISHWGLIGLELVIAANAVYGGIGLARDGLRMPIEWLEPTPFSTWQWPGVFLLLVIAVPMTTAALLEIARSRWAFAASMLAATAQVGWIIVQVAMLRRYFFLQPVLLVAGLLVAALALWSHRSRSLARLAG